LDYNAGLSFADDIIHGIEKHIPAGHYAKFVAFW